MNHTQFSAVIRNLCGIGVATARALQPKAVTRTVRVTTNEGKSTMANAIRKRIALATVVAVGAGLLSVAPASAVDMTATATVGPVRVTTVAGSVQAVPAASFSFTNGSTALTASADLSAVLKVTEAPTTSAEVTVAFNTSASVTDKLADDAAGATDATSGATIAASAAVSGTIALTAANAVAGTYAGTLTITEDNNGTDKLTVSWRFTTTGAASSIEIALAPSTVPSAGTAVSSTATIKVKDAAGNLTQLTTGDTILVTSSDNTEVPTPGTTGTSVSAANLSTGSYDVTVTPKNSATAGTYTITATPQGTLPAAGVTAKTASLTVAAAATQGPASFAVTSPTTDIYVADATATAAITNLNPAAVKGSITVRGTGATPGAPVAVAVDADIASGTNVLKVNGTTVNEAAQAQGTADGTVYVTATAAGVVEFTVDVSGAVVANGDDIALTVTGSPIVAAGNTYAKLTLTYATAALSFTTTPANSGKEVAKTAAAISVSAKAVDQYGNGYANYIVSASQSGTATGATSATTGSTVIARTALNGTATLSVPAPSATFVGSSTLTVTLTDPSGGAVGGGTTSAFTVEYSAAGTAATLVLTDSDTDATKRADNASTREVVIAPANLTAADAADTDNYVAVTVATTGPAALSFTATAAAGSGLRLFTSDPSAGATAIAAGAASVTGTAGTTTIYAVPTLVGAKTFTVAAGGLSQTFTVTGALNGTPKAQIITLTKGTPAAGRVTYTVKTTDVFGNGVAADVSIALSGVGTLSNGFKNINLTTTAAGTNEFDVISSVAGNATVTAAIASASYTAVSAAQATAQSVAASVQTASDTVALTAGGTSSIQEQLTALQKSTSDLIASLQAQISYLRKQLNQILSRLRR